MPAAYDRRAYEVPFNAGFTEILRTPDSWQNSDAFELLEKFTGNLLIIAAEHDEVIPTPIIPKMYESATQAKSRELLVAPGSTHQIYQHLVGTRFANEMLLPRIKALFQA